MFSGSYHPDDVTFLLKPVQLASTPVAEKERWLQSGQRHYSEMITRESLPAPEYERLFESALQREKVRLARDVLCLARHIDSIRPAGVTLVSLARAGTPIGVLLARTLRRRLGRPARHYSISIIRDRGIDANALKHILQYHAPEALVFVDGWTGKGVIAAELRRALDDFEVREDVRLDSGLYTIADLGGAAAFAATTEDYLIPSSILGATVSGLVSRSILNSAVIGPGDFHGCLYYEEFRAHDRSAWFVEQVEREIERQIPVANLAALSPDPARLREQSAAFLRDMEVRFGVRSVHHIKPGIGEATRVLLRRWPERVLLRAADIPEVVHLVLLCREKNVPLLVDPTLPYTAVAIIKELGE